MTYVFNLHHTTPTAHTPLVHDAGDRYAASGRRVAAAEVRARDVASQAARWLAFAAERTRMTPETLTAKALSSVAFSVHHRAAGLAVPSKLAGTSRHQRALWALVRDPAGPWAALDVEADAGGLTVSYDGVALGRVQSKHLGWARPLVPFGLTLHLSRVTGADHAGERPRYTLGCNVAFGHVGPALGRLLDVLGKAGPGLSGDGAPGGPPALSGRPRESDVSHDAGAPHAGAEAAVEAAPRAAPEAAGDGLPASPLRLVVRPEHDAVRPGADPDDVVLWRSIGGATHASVEHVVRHSPTGIEWGYGGSGPADLALSVLTAVVGPEAAEHHYQAFKSQVVASVPYAGGVLRAADVRAWAAGQEPDGR